jgi:formamidopyrimidine-DNA glycosylase
MPELPEVQTTVDGLNATVIGRKIVDVWTDYRSVHKMHADSVKDAKFFKGFKKRVTGAKILRAERRAKNILMHLDNGETILTHMKMTGHYVYDRPDYPHVRIRFDLDNGKTLGLSDMRRFAKVTLVQTKDLEASVHLSNLGPEPLEISFTYPKFKARIMKRPKGKIKSVLMDPSIVAGIGNIYSDEILWRAGVHPLSKPGKIPEKNMKAMFLAMKETLKKGIRLGGDSTSDYKNIEGQSGDFHNHHEAYRRTGKKCSRDNGIITRIVIGARSAHFCPVHQKLFK